MYIVIIILLVLASLLMIGIVLIQESKGGGLASSFSSSNQIMGVRKTTDFLEKATWGLAIAIVVLSIISLSFVSSNTAQSDKVFDVTAPVTNTQPADNAAPQAQGAQQPQPAQ